MTLIELFNAIDKAKSQKERGELLTQNKTDHLENMLWYTFHPDVKFLLPESDPPFIAQAEDPRSTMLYGQIRKFRYFVEGPGGTDFCAGANIDPSRREVMFITMLESVTPREAKMILGVKNKDLGISGLTYRLVQETFPHLIPPLPVSEKKKTK
jgi:hypothetical protein